MEITGVSLGRIDEIRTFHGNQKKEPRIKEYKSLNPMLKRKVRPLLDKVVHMYRYITSMIVG